MCGKIFTPLKPEGEFHFICPECGSELTTPYGGEMDNGRNNSDNQTSHI